MTKIQKIWFWIFIVVFLVPEVLLGPVLGGINFLFHTRFNSILSSQLTLENSLITYAVLLAESVGVVGVFILNQKIKNYEIIKVLINTIIILVILVLTLVWYMSLSLDGILK